MNQCCVQWYDTLYKYTTVYLWYHRHSEHSCNKTHFNANWILTEQDDLVTTHSNDLKESPFMKHNRGRYDVVTYLKITYNTKRCSSTYRSSQGLRQFGVSGGFSFSVYLLSWQSRVKYTLMNLIIDLNKFHTKNAQLILERNTYYYQLCGNTLYCGDWTIRCWVT